MSQNPQNLGLKHKVIYRERRFHAAFPSIVRFSDGNLVLAFRRARDGGWLIPEEKRRELDPLARMDHLDSRSHIVLLELDTEGENQIAAPEMLPVDPEAGDQDPSLLVLPDDCLFVTSFSWYPLPADAVPHVPGRPAQDDDTPGCRYISWGSHCSLRSRKNGKWLRHHAYIEPEGLEGKAVDPDGSKLVWGGVRGRPLGRQNEILLALYGGEERRSVLLASADQGANWSFRGLIARDPTGKVAYQEPALCEDGRGGLVCFMRTAGADGRLATSRSQDGACWSKPVLHNLIGHPFHPLPLSDGRLLLTYGYRRQPYGVRARLLNTPSDDPDGFPEIILRDDGLCSDLGYPWGVQLVDGRVLVVYYLTDQQGLRHIAGTWLIL